MTVSGRGRSRRALEAAAHRLGRPSRGGGAEQASPAGTPAHLQRLPHLVLSSGEVVHVARTFRARLRGLLGTDELPAGHALLLTDTRSIHMLGMHLTLDLVWIDAAGRLVRVDRAVGPGSSRRCTGARSVLEVGAGEGDRFAELVRTASLAMLTGH